MSLNFKCGRKTVLLMVVVALSVSQSMGVVAQSIEERRELLLQRRAWLKSAHELQEAGEHEKALIILDSVLIIDAKNAGAYYLKGVIFAEEGDTAKAQEALEAGVRAAPLSTRLKLRLARLYLATDELLAADSLIDATLAYKPREPLALFLKGLTLVKVGDTATALASFELALRIALRIDGLDGR